MSTRIISILICAVLFSFALQASMYGIPVSSEKNVFAVVDASSGVPLSGVLVTAFGSGGFGYTNTDNDGHFNITNGITSGNYTVVASQQGYLNAENDSIMVTAGSEVSGVTFYMSLSGGIFGRVTDNVTGYPIPNKSVSASPSFDNTTYFRSGLTDTFGNYAILTNLGTGTYNVNVLSPQGYVGKTIGPVSVTAGSKTMGINLSLQRSGIISGRITTLGGQGLANLTVTTYTSTFTYFGSGQTNATGYYSIASGLGTDSDYTVAVTSLSPYAANSTSGIGVTAGQETSGVDLELAIPAPQPSGIIMGTVMDTHNKPLASVQVTASGDTTFSFGSASTDQNGNYVISTSLANDTYNVTASVNGYQVQSFPGQSVTVNQVTTVNFHLQTIPAQSIWKNIRNCEWRLEPNYP